VLEKLTKSNGRRPRKGTGPCFRIKVDLQKCANRPKNGPVPGRPVNGYTRPMSRLLTPSLFRPVLSPVLRSMLQGTRRAGHRRPRAAPDLASGLPGKKKSYRRPNRKSHDVFAVQQNALNVTHGTWPLIDEAHKRGVATGYQLQAVEFGRPNSPAVPDAGPAAKPADEAKFRAAIDNAAILGTPYTIARS